MNLPPDPSDRYDDPMLTGTISDYEEPNADDLAAVDAFPKAPGTTRIEQLQWIVDNRQAAFVGDQPVDLFTASVMVQCYAVLNPKHHETFETAPFMKVVTACWASVRSVS